MTQYLVAVQLPDNFDPAGQDPATEGDIEALNEEMRAAGIRVFVGGLVPVSFAKALRTNANGQVIITDGPFSEAKEHIGGFWVIETKSLEEALEWGRNAAIACRAPVEVRAFA